MIKNVCLGVLLVFLYIYVLLVFMYIYVPCDMSSDEKVIDCGAKKTRQDMEG
jgi:hypothetical protein